MELLHSRVHCAFRRDLDRSDLMSGDFTPALFTVSCPNCGAEYFANPLRDVPPLTDAAARQAARTDGRGHLTRECPDHAHRFQLAP